MNRMSRGEPSEKKSHKSWKHTLGKNLCHYSLSNLVTNPKKFPLFGIFFQIKTTTKKISKLDIRASISELSWGLYRHEISRQSRCSAMAKLFEFSTICQDKSEIKVEVENVTDWWSKILLMFSFYGYNLQQVSWVRRSLLNIFLLFLSEHLSLQTQSSNVIANKG